MVLMPFYVNTAQMAFFKEGNEDYVRITFGYASANIPQTFDASLFVTPVITVLMNKETYKHIAKQFQSFLAQREEHTK